MLKEVMVVGAGGREHALAWKLSQSASVSKVYVAPGNAGTASDKIQNLDIKATDNKALVDFAVNNKIALVVVGPEICLINGLVDDLTASGIEAFGPTKEQSKLEWSKAYSKNVLKKLNIPTARFAVTETVSEALSFIESKENDWALVIKLDGLAAGKGVYVCQDIEQARVAINELAAAYGEGDKLTLVLEEKLAGKEISLFCLCDGKTILPLRALQDHKRRFDGDKGPNTGGMGAFTPVPVYEQYREVIDAQVVKPLGQAFVSGALDFKGLLFIGILMQQGVPYVLEFNARFGDPECEAMMPLLSSDLYELLLASAQGTLAKQPATVWRDGVSVTFIAVNREYPQKSSSGVPIKIGKIPDGVTLFHCGTAIKDGQVVTSGGRILAPTAVAPTVEQACELALTALKAVSFDGMDYRTDIARGGKLCPSK